MTEGHQRTVSIRRVRQGAKLPARAKRFDAGYDVFAAESFTLEPGEVKKVPVGFAIDVPPGWVGLVCPRSGLAVRQWVTVFNGPGIIDPTYDGEVQVALHNARSYRYEGRRFDGIAQLVLTQAFTPELELSHTEWDRLDLARGIAGFGSTGR